MQQITNDNGDKRKRRVKNLKRMIVGFIIMMIAIPTVFCVVLSCKMLDLQKKVDELTKQNALLEAASLESVSEQDMDETEAAVHQDEASYDAGLEKELKIKKVYLTFDDGPSSNTGKILDILNSYGVKGNFFVVGTKNEALLPYYKRIVDEGHVLAMHSYSHRYDEIYRSEEAFLDDLTKIQSLIYEETGSMPNIYRFPGGSSNTVSSVDMKELEALLTQRGITYYDWNISSGDATNPMPPAKKIVENSLKDLNEYEEAMILMHDLSNKTSTVEALPAIIEGILAMDVEIAPITQDSMLIQHANTI